MRLAELWPEAPWRFPVFVGAQFTARRAVVLHCCYRPVKLGSYMMAAVPLAFLSRQKTFVWDMQTVMKSLHHFQT